MWAKMATMTMMKIHPVYYHSREFEANNLGHNCAAVTVQSNYTTHEAASTSGHILITFNLLLFLYSGYVVPSIPTVSPPALK